jgi:YVTN family beta-propeller protein
MKRLCFPALMLLACGHGDHAHATSDDPSSVPIARVDGPALYVVNGGDNSISVLDPAGRSLGTIALKNVSFPHHVYLSPDKKKLAVGVPSADLSGGHAHHAGHAGAGAVLVLDADTGATLASRRFEAPTHNAVFSADGREVWTALMRDAGEVLVLDAGTLEVKQRIAAGAQPAEVTFSADGKIAFVANGGSANVTVIDASTKAVLKTIAVDANPVGAWAGVDGAMYVDCETAKTIKAIDVKTLSVVRTYDLKFTPGMAATPSKSDLWITDADAGKVIFNETAQDNRTGDLATGSGAHAIAFSADGKTAYVTNQSAGSVTVIDVASKRATVTVPVGSRPNGLAYR